VAGIRRFECASDGTLVHYFFKLFSNSGLGVESKFRKKVPEGWATIRDLSRQPFESESLMLDFAAKGSDVTCPPAISQHLVEEVF
jgi:hypothetical protein